MESNKYALVIALIFNIFICLYADGLHNIVYNSIKGTNKFIE